MKIRSIISKAIIAGMCLSVIPAGVVLANPGTMEDRVIQRTQVASDNPIYQKQRKLDQALFETHAKEISAEGFTVTHTGPKETYIEVGITPYSGENADYIYNLIGKDGVKVVEGQQAYLMPLPIDGNVSPGDQPISDNDQRPISTDNIRWISPDYDISVQTGMISETAISVLINNKLVEMDVLPIIEDGRTLVPLRGVMEKMGATVNWDAAERAVHIWGDTNIILFVGQNKAEVTRKIIVNNTETTTTEILTIDVLAKIIDGRTFIPSRFVAETLGAKVEWDQEKRMVTIETRDMIESPDHDVDTIEGEIGPSLAEMEKTINVNNVKEMKLYSLMGEELKVFSQGEIIEIFGHLNTGATYNGPHILMLAGNIIKITLEDQGEINLSSYGFEDHVVLSGKIDGESRYYVIVAPEVGKILLRNMEI